MLFISQHAGELVLSVIVATVIGLMVISVYEQICFDKIITKKHNQQQNTECKKN